jgi:hypothetical protein
VLTQFYEDASVLLKYFQRTIGAPLVTITKAFRFLHGIFCFLILIERYSIADKLISINSVVTAGASYVLVDAHCQRAHHSSSPFNSLITVSNIISECEPAHSCGPANCSKNDSFSTFRLLW